MRLWRMASCLDLKARDCEDVLGGSPPRHWKPCMTHRSPSICGPTQRHKASQSATQINSLGVSFCHGPTWSRNAEVLLEAHDIRFVGVSSLMSQGTYTQVQELKTHVEMIQGVYHYRSKHVNFPQNRLRCVIFVVFTRVYIFI